MSKYKRLEDKILDVADIVDKELNGSCYADELREIAEKVKDIPWFKGRVMAIEEKRKKKLINKSK